MKNISTNFLLLPDITKMGLISKTRHMENSLITKKKKKVVASVFKQFPKVHCVFSILKTKLRVHYN